MKISCGILIKNVRFLNNRGFTMLEMLFAFSIFLMVVSFFPLAFNYFFKVEPFEARNKVMGFFDAKKMVTTIINAYYKIIMNSGFFANPPKLTRTQESDAIH